MGEEVFDIAIIGAGIAGASLAADLPDTLRVVLLEGEDAPGYHSTGRSAAIFSAIYGNGAIRALSRASQAFLASPPLGFSDPPLVSPRGVLFVARADQQASMAALASQLEATGGARRVSAAEACILCPPLRPDYVAHALYERDALDLDVHALHAGFLRMARARGHRLVNQAAVQALAPDGGGWSIETTAGPFRAAILVNAAGAWADQVAVMAGVPPKGVQAMRRTAVLAEVAGPAPDADAPMTVDVDEQFYFKPESGGVLVSPADETAVAPGDAQPEEMDIAVAVDRFEQATTLAVRKIRNAWAGLRNFAPDRTPVVGFDDASPTFFWLAGQGGYGIQTAPALGRLAAALVRQGKPPQDIIDQGLALGDLAPGRFAPQGRTFELARN